MNSGTPVGLPAALACSPARLLAGERRTRAVLVSEWHRAGQASGDAGALIPSQLHGRKSYAASSRIQRVMLSFVANWHRLMVNIYQIANEGKTEWLDPIG